MAVIVGVVYKWHTFRTDEVFVKDYLYSRRIWQFSL